MSASIKRFQFNTKAEYNEAIRLLSNFYKAGNGNPPTGKEEGVYRENYAWLFIDITKGDIDIPFGTVSYRQPEKYVVINHGGYLD